MIVATIGTIELITITLISLLAMRDLILYFVTSKTGYRVVSPIYIPLFCDNPYAKPYNTVRSSI